MVHVVIVGGGIAGLATAYFLQKEALQAGIPLHYTLVESDGRLGGKILTHQADGFTIEGGPDSFFTQKPQALALCRELGLESDLIGVNSERRKVYVLRRGKLVTLPEGIMGGVPTRFLPFVLSPLISPLGKLRMGLDLFIPPRSEDEDESVGNFFRRRLGNEAVDRFAEPLLAGIHVANADHLSLKATFPRFLELERKHRSLIRGMLASRRVAASVKTTSAPLPLFMALQNGMQDLVESLASHLQGDIVLGRSVVRLEHPAGRGKEQRLHLDDGRSLSANATVLAIPAYVAADLVEPFAPPMTALLRTIRYVSSATVSLAFPCSEIPHPLDGTGFLIPASEKRRILACTWSSVKFSQRAPDGLVLLRCFIGGSRDENLLSADDETLTRMARTELRDIMDIEAAPQMTRLYRWERANPQYETHHLDRVEQIEALSQEIPGLYLTGSSYRGIGIPDCIAQGKATAAQIFERLNAGL